MKIGRNSYCSKVPVIIGSSPYGYRAGSLIPDGKLVNYVDLMSGTGCTGWGSTSKVHQKIFKRMLDSAIPTNAYDYNTVYRNEAESLLHELVPGYDFGFFSGGAEAVEAALRAAKDIAKTIHNKEGKIAAFTNCFHGKTYLTGLLTDNKNTNQTVILNYNDPTIIIPDDVSIVILESVQTRNGVNIATHEFLHNLFTQCEKRGIVVIVDEISSGYRVGTPTAIEELYPSFQPDIITLGKNYGQGIPVSILAIRNSHIEVVKTSLTSGYGSNPLACIAVTESIKEFKERKEEIQQRATSLYNTLKEALLSIPDNPHIEKITNMGMWFSIILKDTVDINKIADRLLKEGFIIGVVNNNIRLAPQFDLPDEVWMEFIVSLSTVLDEI